MTEPARAPGVSDRCRAKPAVVDPDRPVGRRQDGGRQALRGPRLHGRRQPAGRAAARPRGARVARTGGASPGSRSSLDVRAGDASVALGGHARRARGPRHPAAGRLPRGARRRPHPPLQRDAPPPPAGRRPRDRQLDRGGAAHPRPGPRRGRRRRSTPPTCRSASCASGSSPSWPRRRAPDQLAIQLISFGFKYGVPLEADLVFDVRFMQNPYYVADLRPLSGLTDEVRDFVLGQPVAQRFLDFLERVPRRSRSRRTSPRARRGSRSRSAAPAATTARSSSPRSSRPGCASGTSGPVAVFHRELDRP